LNEGINYKPVFEMLARCISRAIRTAK